jgi:hypothetical protein
VSTATVSPAQLDVAGLSQSAAAPVDALTGREAPLRSAATVCLAGIPLAQAIALPSLLAQGWQWRG